MENLKLKRKPQRVSATLVCKEGNMQQRYNYLPHPISEYGPYKSLPGDSAMVQLARKDQASWNLWYLSDGCIDTWHKIYVMPTNDRYVQMSRKIGQSLTMWYQSLATQFDGVTVRHQIEHLPPSEFLQWFLGHGGYASLPIFAPGQPAAQMTPGLLTSCLSREQQVQAGCNIIP